MFVASSRTNKLQHTALLHSRVRSPRGNAASYHGCHGCQAHQGPWLSAAAPAHGAYGAEEKKASTTSRHQADCIGQIFLCGFTRQDADRNERTTLSATAAKGSYRGPRWCTLESIVGHFSFFFFLFFISLPFHLKESRPHSTDLSRRPIRRATMKNFHSRYDAFKSRGTPVKWLTLTPPAVGVSVPTSFPSGFCSMYELSFINSVSQRARLFSTRFD